MAIDDKKKLAALAKQRFMNPGAGGTQLTKPVGRGATFAERGFAPPRTRPRVIRTSQPQQALIGRDSGMGWQARMSANKQILSNRQSGLNNQNTNATIQRGQDSRLALGIANNATTQRGQNQVFQLGQADNLTKSRGQEQAFQLGTNRNEIARQGSDSVIATREQAFDKAENREQARQSYAQALTSGDPSVIASAKANYETFSQKAPAPVKSMSPYEAGRLEQSNEANFQDFAASMKLESGITDQDTLMKMFLARQQALRGTHTRSQSQALRPVPVASRQDDMNALF